MENPTILEMVADKLKKRDVSGENIIERIYSKVMYEDHSAKDVCSASRWLRP